MTQLKASQVIFSEEQASYRLLFASSSVPSADAALLEARTRCFQPSQGQARYQFFPLPSGAFALTLSSSLADPPPEDGTATATSTDFIAHALVFSPQDYALLRGDPFKIFQQHNPDAPLFIQTRAELQEELSQPRDSLALELRERRPPPLPQDWQPPELLAMFLLAGEGHKSLRLHGSPDAILAMISFLHYLATPSLRPKLSFDTWAEGCPQDGLWAIGSLPPESSQTEDQRLYVDLTQGLKITAFPPQALGYETWLEEALNAWEQYADDVPTLQEVAQAFRTQQPFHYAQAQEAAMVSALEAYHQAAQEGMRLAWEALLSREASQAMLDFLGDLAHTQHFGLHRESLITILSACTAQRFTDPSIPAQALYDWIRRANPPILRQERDKLLRLAQNAKHEALRLVAILYDERRWGFGLGERERQREEALNALEHNDQLMDVLKDLCGRYDWATPVRFVAEFSANKLAYFVANMTRISDDDLLDVIEALLRYEQYDALSRLVPLTLRMERSLAERIYKRLSRYGKLPVQHPFFAAVERSARA